MQEAPISGVLTEINLKVDGYTDTVNPGVVITDVNNLYIVAKVKDSFIKDVKKDQDVKITGAAFDKKDSFKGKVTKIAPVAAKAIGESGEEITIDVEISLAQKSKKLKPGLKVECEITTVVKKDIVLGKFEMLKNDKDNNKFMFIVDTKTNKVKQVKVELGVISDMKFEILKGISEGDMVILDPIPSLKDGDQVEISKDK